MLRVLYFCLALSFCILQAQSSEYTWESYDGTIPEKAFVASDDPNNPVYVGMAEIKKSNCSGTLFPGANEMTVACNGGMHKVKEGIKILTVNDPKKFKWFSTPRQGRFWEDIKTVGSIVKCGKSSHHNNAATMVGRTITDDDGSLVVGHITSAVFYLVHKDRKRQKSSNYQILLIVEKPVPPPPQSKDYTWEDYNGTIPEKAFSVSDDPNNPVYVGLASLFAEYCPGSLLPGATEITVECYGVHTIKKDLKILTVNDPTKFKWFPTPRKGIFWEDIGSVGNPVRCGDSVSRQNLATLVGRTITDDDGTLVVGHINNPLFYLAHNNKARQKSSGYEILIIVEKPVPPPPQSKDYAWEDYDGTIPEKSFSASDNPNNPVYVGLALIFAEYCPGTLLPGATEITVECYGAHTIKKDLKILTVNDPTKFKWLPAPLKGSLWEEIKSVGNPVTSGPSVSQQKTSTLVGRTIVGDNGTLVVGHVNLEIFHFVDNNRKKQISSNYEVLIRVKEPAPAQSQNKEPLASEEPTAVKPSEPTVDTNVDPKVETDAQTASKGPSVSALDCTETTVDIKVEADAPAAPEAPSIPKASSVPEEPSTPKTPSTSKEPTPLHPSEPFVDTNVNLQAEAALNLPSAPKETSIPKAPSASKELPTLNPSESTVGTSVDLKVEADAQAAPKSPFAPKTSSVPKEPSTPKSPSAAKDPPALNPSEPTVGTNVDLKVEAAPGASFAPKAQFALKEPTASKAPFGSKAPAASNPNLPTVDANVDLKAPAAPKAPATPNLPAAPKAQTDFKVNSFVG